MSFLSLSSAGVGAPQSAPVDAGNSLIASNGDEVQIAKAEGLRGALGLFEVTIAGQTQYLTRDELEQRNLAQAVPALGAGAANFAAGADGPTGGAAPTKSGSIVGAGGGAPSKAIAAKPVAAHSIEQLREFAKWPERAHTAWKSLTQLERITVLENMRKRYGKDFTEQFLAFTKSGARHDGIEYGPHFPEHTPQWYAAKGYKLAQRDSVNEWWVHPSGKDIMANRDGSVLPPPTMCAEGDSTELLNSTLDWVNKEIADIDESETQAIAAKEDLYRMNITTPEYAKAYQDFVERLDGGQPADGSEQRYWGLKDVEASLAALDDAETALKAMCADTTQLDELRGRLEEQRTWFQVQKDLLKMEGREPINIHVID